MWYTNGESKALGSAAVAGDSPVDEAIVGLVVS